MRTVKQQPVSVSLKPMIAIDMHGQIIMPIGPMARGRITAGMGIGIRTRAICSASAITATVGDIIHPIIEAIRATMGAIAAVGPIAAVPIAVQITALAASNRRRRRNLRRHSLRRRRLHSRDQRSAQEIGGRRPQGPEKNGGTRKTGNSAGCAWRMSGY